MVNTCKSGFSSGTCVGLAPAVLWRQACTEGTALAGAARGNLSIWSIPNADTCFMLSCVKDSVPPCLSTSGHVVETFEDVVPHSSWHAARSASQSYVRASKSSQACDHCISMRTAYEAQQYRASGADL